MITVTGADITAWVGSYLWPFVRIGAFVGAAPIFGTRFLPTRLKIVIAIVLTIIISPIVDSVPVIDAVSADGILIVIQQVLIGLSMGFAMHLVFSAFVLGGQIIAMSMGLGFASMNDPSSGVVVPTVGQLYTILVTLAFLSVNGHLIMISVIADSFTTMPIAVTGISTTSIWNIVAWAGYMFKGALLIALPSLGAMLVVNLGLGVITRAAPQLNIFAVGFPVIMTFGFIVILFGLSNAMTRFTGITNDAFLMLSGLVAGG